jgi:hypothetical protein
MEVCVTLTDLTLLILQLNHIVDHDLHRGVSIQEAHDHIEAGDVFEWLKKKFGTEIDLSIYQSRPSKDEISKQWQQIFGAYAGDENRRWGISHNGICLLLAWTNEIVQQRTAYKVD